LLGNRAHADRHTSSDQEAAARRKEKRDINREIDERLKMSKGNMQRPDQLRPRRGVERNKIPVPSWKVLAIIFLTVIFLVVGLLAVTLQDQQDGKTDLPFLATFTAPITNPGQQSLPTCPDHGAQYPCLTKVPTPNLWATPTSAIPTIPSGFNPGGNPGGGVPTPAIPGGGFSQPSPGGGLP
jgi:hypothetical protein